MRDFHEASLVKAVLHQVFPRQDMLTLSEAELQLTTDVEEFLLQLTLRGVRDGQAKAANFATTGSGTAASLSTRLLRPGITTWIQDSQSLARLLFEAAKRVNASDATFAVVVARGDIDGSARNVLSLLKLDPAAVFHPVERRDSRGRLVVELELQPDALPRSAQGIQKCAFVGPPNLGLEYRILAIDRQNEGVADFFLTRFLGAEFVLDSKERTERLYRILKQTKNEIAPTLPSDQLVALDRVIDGAVVAARANVDELVGSLPIDERARELFESKLSARLPDRQFDLDRETVNKILKRKRFEADNGLFVSVPADFLDQMVEVIDVQGSDPPKRRVVITTQKWKEV